MAYQVPTLLKTAYYACSNDDRESYDVQEVPDVDLENCCQQIFQILAIQKYDGDERQTMFDRLLTIDDQNRFLNLCGEAASHVSHINCLKLAKEMGVSWGTDEVFNILNDNACEQAASSGSLACLIYARVNGCPWDEKTCSNAARSGNLDCLEYAHRNGCPWDENTCHSAARNGHKDCLIYAWENECPWNGKTCSDAALNGHMDCLDYARENGCP